MTACGNTVRNGGLQIRCGVVAVCIGAVGAQDERSLGGQTRCLHRPADSQPCFAANVWRD
jgi:hypothetical protein